MKTARRKVKTLGAGLTLRVRRIVGADDHGEARALAAKVDLPEDRQIADIACFQRLDLQDGCHAAVPR